MRIKTTAGRKHKGQVRAPLAVATKTCIFRPLEGEHLMRFATWVLVCAALLAATVASADTAERDVKVLHAGTAHRDLYAMAVDPQDDNSVIAVGGFGALVTTKDGGETWKDAKLDTDMALLDIIIEGKRKIVVGQSGFITIQDGDGKWKQIPSGTDARLLGVGGNSAGLTFAVGQFGIVLRSKDGGDSWQRLDLKLSEKIEGGYDPHLYDVHVSEEGVATVVGEFGLIMRSSDAGEHWDIVNTSDESLLALQIRDDDGVGFAVGQSGVVFRTEDGGKNWTRLDTDLDANLLAVWVTRDGVVTLPGFRHMAVSDNNGESWLKVQKKLVNRAWFADVAKVGDTPGVVAVGVAGTIIRITRVGN